MTLSALTRRASLTAAGFLLATTAFAGNKPDFNFDATKTTKLFYELPSRLDDKDAIKKILVENNQGKAIAFLEVWADLIKPVEDWGMQNNWNYERMPFRTTPALHPHVQKTVMSYKDDPVKAGIAISLIAGLDKHMYGNRTTFYFGGMYGNPTWANRAASLASATNGIDGLFPGFVEDAKRYYTPISNGISQKAIASWRKRNIEGGHSDFAKFLEDLFPSYALRTPTPSTRQALKQ